MKSFKTLSICVLSTTVLLGCGGGGGSTPTPNGIYTGTVTGGAGSPPYGPNGDEKGIIYNNRLMVFSNVYDIQQMYDASITVTGSSFSGTVSNYDNSNSPKRFTADLSGTFTTNTSVTASVTNFSRSGFTDATITLTADTSLYNRGSSAATVTGSWQGTHSGMVITSTLAIDSAGAITGSDDQGCNFTGTIAPADTTLNVYNVSITSTGGAGCTSLPAATYTGFAWTEGASDTTMNLTVADGINSRSVILTKT